MNLYKIKKTEKKESFWTKISVDSVGNDNLSKFCIIWYKKFFCLLTFNNYKIQMVQHVYRVRITLWIDKKATKEVAFSIYSSAKVNKKIYTY